MTIIRVTFQKCVRTVVNTELVISNTFTMRKKSERKLLSVINSSGNIKGRVIGQSRNVEPVGQIMFDTGSGLNISRAFFAAALILPTDAE